MTTVAGAFKAGTVFVDVVPSLKGFYKDVSNTVRAEMPRAGQEAGDSFSKGFSATASNAGKEVLNAFADPLGKSVARLKTEASQAGQALAQAQDQVAASAGRLRAARAQEESAAQAAARAEQDLDRARRTGSADDVARAETHLAAALDRSKAANSAADRAAADYSKALGNLEVKTKAADNATDALAVAEGRHSSEATRAGASAGRAADGIEDLDRAADAADDSVKSSGGALSAFSGAVRSAMGPILAIGAAMGIGGLTGEALSASDATDKFKQTLKFAGVDTTTIDRLTESAKAYADATVYELSDIQNVTAQLAANGVEGYDRLAEAAGNLNAVAGGNADTFRSVGMVLTQTAGQGKLTTENFNQLSDAIPGASGKIQQALAEAGAYTGNFREAMEKGEISAQEFNAAILQLGSDEIAQAAARSTTTWEGAAGNLQAALVSGVTDFLNWIKPTVTEAMSWMADSFAQGISWVKDHKDEMLALGVAVGVAVAAYAGFSILTSVKAWIASTTLAQQGLNAALRANPVGIVITALAALAAGIYLLYQRNEGFRLKVQELGKTVVSVWQEWIWPAISAVWDWISGTLLPGIQSVWNILAHGDFDGNLFGLEEDSGFVTFLFSVRDAAAAAWEWIAGTLVPAVQGFWTGTLQPILAAIGDAVSTAWSGYIYPALSALWGFITGSLVPAVQGFWTGTLQPILAAIGDAVSTAWSGYIYPALSALWGFITGSLAPAVQEFWAGIVQPVFSTIGAFIATVWNGAILPALTALWGFITGTLGPAISGFWAGIVQPAFSAIGSIISTAWTQYISPALSALWSFVTGVLMPMVSTLWGVIQPIITAIGNLIVSAWSNVIYPALSALWGFISGVLGPIFMWLWNSVVQPAFQTIGNIISMVWNGVVSPIFSAMVAVVRDVLGPIFMWLWNNVISPVWGWISDKISGVVNFVADTVFPRIKTAIDTAKTGFDNFKTGVETAMNGIKKAAATPVNFVINTVYRDGIKKAFDTIAEKVGLSLRLPTVSPIAGYASGGRWRTMLPGYTPGKDVYHFFSPDGGGAIRMSGGEGIIRPDSLRALGGKPWLDRVNASRGRGLADVGDTGARRGRVSFAEGGVWGAIGAGFDAALGWVKDTASAVADIVSDPLGAVASLIIEPAKALLGSISSGFWGQILAQAPTLLFESIKNVFKGGVDEQGLAGASGLVDAARRAIGVSYVWGGSSIPPGLDCSGLVYWAAQQLGLGWPRLTAASYQSGSTPISWDAKQPGDLLFWGSPAHHVAIFSGNGKMVEEPHEGASGREIAIWGSPTVGRYGGARKYDAGGVLPPGVHAAVNATGAPEAVLTARQWADVHALVDRGGADPDALARALDGLGVSLVLDDGEALDAHIEVVASSVARRSRRLAGRGR